MSYEEYLQHHGILGMRWGKRNGPPYPLEPSQMSAKERADNDIREYSARVRVTKRKEREKIRRTKVKEREQIRQNKVDEKEQIRQNKVDEKEWARQNKVENLEATRQYQQGRKFVRNRLIGIGVMALSAYQISKWVAEGTARRAGG